MKQPRKFVEMGLLLIAKDMGSTRIQVSGCRTTVFPVVLDPVSFVTRYTAHLLILKNLRQQSYNFVSIEFLKFVEMRMLLMIKKMGGLPQTEIWYKNYNSLVPSGVLNYQ